MCKCPNGPYGAAVLMFVNGRDAGSLFAGQFLLYRADISDIEQFSERARFEGFEGIAYLKALEKVITVPSAHLGEILNCLRWLTAMLSEMGSGGGKQKVKKAFCPFRSRSRFRSHCRGEEEGRGKLSSFLVDKKTMYVNAQPPPVLTLAVQPEISIRSGTESQPLKLQPYQIVRAVVAEGGLEKVVLDVEQRKLEARTKVPLRTGQQLNLQVLSTKSPIHLRIMEEAELRHLFRLLHNLDDSPRLLPVLAKLHCGRGSEADEVRLTADVKGFLESFMALIRKSPARLTATDMAGIQKMLGLDLERLLAENKTSSAKNTLKGALLMIAGSAGKTAGSQGAQAQSLLEQLQLFALCRYRLGKENVQFLPLPLPFLETGYILAEKDGRGKEGGEGGEENGAWRMNIHLKLSRLGNLQILLLFEDDRTLRLRVLCESDETVRLVSSELPSLADRLSTVTLAGYSVGSGAKDPVASLLKRLAPQGDHFLEVEV